MSSFHGGQTFNQYGSHSIGVSNVNNAPATQQDALRELAEAVNALQTRLSPEDRQVVDASMRTVGPNAEPGGFRRALRDISGVASMVGGVGVPVIEAVRKVMAAFGLG
jgi:hypothetical protein